MWRTTPEVWSWFMVRVPGAHLTLYLATIGHSAVGGVTSAHTMLQVLLLLPTPTPAPVPRCSPFVFINKLAEFSNIWSDSNPYFPVGCVCLCNG